MDSRVDFALDRSRILAPNLSAGTLGPMTSYGNDLSRAGVTELARTATPATMTSLAQYQSRFLPSTMSMHSPGASFALMGGLLGGAAPADNLKTLMPDMQQLWTPHSDGYPRFVINNTPYSPFGPFLPTAADTLPTLLPPGPAAPSGADPAHCHRIYELQKDAFLASVAASQAGLYGILPNGHPFLEQTSSPLQQPQVPALPLGVVKQEPRESSSSCQASSERSSSKAGERRHLSSTPRGADPAGARRDPPKDNPLSVTGPANTNVNNSNINNNSSNASNNNNCGGSARNPSVHRPPGSKSQTKAQDNKEVLKATSREQVPAKDKRPGGSVKQSEKSAEPVLCKPKLPVGNGVVSKNDAAKRAETAAVSVKNPKTPATKPTHNPAAQQKLSCSSQETPAGAGCRTATVSKTVSVCKDSVKVAVSSGKSGNTGKNAELRAPASAARVSAKSVVDHSITTSSTAPLDSHKKHPRDKGDRVKDGGGSSVSVEEGRHPQGSSSGSDVRSKTTLSTASSRSLTPKSTPVSVVSTHITASGPTSVNNSTSQVVPTLVTVTSTSCDVSTVTSVPVTSCGTQSVFARSQPVTSTSLTGASPTQLKSNSVTSQVATSALPYYHTLYSKAEGGEQGTVGVKKVHATTTFVPEVGTFKGPLIRNMSKGCPDSRAVKSEQPRSSACCREDNQGSKPGVRASDGAGEVAGERSEGSHGEGSEDEASDLSMSASHKRSQESDRGENVSYEELRERQERPPGDRGFPASLGDVSSSSRSSVPFLGNKAPAVGVQSSEDSAEDVALDFSMSKRSKEFTESRKCHEDRQSKASDRSSGVSVGKGVLKHSSSRSVASSSTSTSSCVPKVCNPVQRSEPREAGTSSASSSSATSSLQMTRVPHPGHSIPRQGPPLSPPLPVVEVEGAALNLSKSVTKKKSTKESDVASKRKTVAGSSRAVGGSAEVPPHGTSPGSRVSQVVATEKRCGSAPPHSLLLTSGAQKDYMEEEEEEEEEENTESAMDSEEKDPTEHTASNIPVGIAVAQQRADGGRVDVRAGVSRSEDAENSRQLAHDFNEREDYLRQQKSVLTGAAKPIPNTGLPPNLVVTGGDNSLTDDLRLRPLPNQWLAAGHGIAASPWLPQNPFALHPAIPTSSTAFDPNHQPGVALAGGFKFAHDSLTGQLLIIPSGELVDQNSLWSAFQSGAASQPIPSAFPPLAVPLSQHAPVSAATSVPTTTENDEHAQAEESTEVSHSEENNSVCEEDSSEEQQSPEQLQQLAAFSRDRPTAVSAVVSINNNNVTESREKGDGVNLNNAFVPTDLTAAHTLALQAAAAAAGITPPQFPFVFNPALLSLPPTVPVGEAVSIKTETPTVQSRGCSPIIMSPTPSEEAAEKASSAAEARKQVDTACASVQTSADLDLKSDASLTSCKEQGIQTSFGDHLQPLSVICATPELHDLHKDTAPLGALAAAALVAEGRTDAMATVARGNRETGVTYNPFTDPQILQAADGLELLSALAEKRPKCSSAALVDPKAVFPSPSDSFKSDTPLPCPELEEASSVGEGERSGGTTPRGDRPRDISPKWGPPTRKDAGQSTSTVDLKLPTSLANMDALELDMRIQLAELQRQYREKQRELAKLQPKKGKEEGVKRGRGRPRKRQLLSGKNDDESSNSSGGKTIKEGSVKRRRPAEELVDRVFRKLPPAKLGKLKMKSISLKHKRRPSHSAGTDADGAKEVGKKKSKHRHDTGNLFSNLESSFSKSSGKKKVKRQSEIPATVTSGLSHTPTTITPVTLESGLGLLAKFATSALTSTPSSTTFSGQKRKSEECTWDTGLGETPSFGSSPGHSPLNKRRESDTDNSDTANGTCIKKRKPGRPRKCDPNKTTGFTETIWARQTGLLQLSDVAQGKTWVSKAEEAATTSTTTTTTSAATTPSQGSKLAASQASLAPLLLDEWSLRRSERIFLNDTSPLPSPSLQPAKDSAAKAPGPRDSRSSSTGPGRPAGGGGRGRPPGTGYKQRQRANSLSAEKLRQQQSAGTSSNSQSGQGKVKDRDMGAGTETCASGSLKVKGKGREEKRDKDHAKVQKARSLQELTQRVKRKYNKKLNKKTSAISSQEEKRKNTTKKERPKAAVEERLGSRRQTEEDSSSEGDNVPLSTLRERAVTPEPRSCVIRQEELQEGLSVLFFRDCLFYEGVVQAIQPPDIYGVVVTGQRGTRPHICSREEILKDAVMAVPPGSQRYVKEGTRVCAYWSQQFRCLYPGTVAKTSPNPHAESSVNVEFDDGDSGRIPISHIRLLPQDFPLVTEEPDPLLYPTKKRRRTISEDDFRKNTEDRHSTSSLSRRNSRSHLMDDTVSDDGSVFDALSLKSGSGSKTLSRARACKEESSVKTRTNVKTREATAASASKPGSSGLKRAPPRRAGGKESESEEDDSDEDESSSEEDEESSSSEDERKPRTLSRGRTGRQELGKKGGRGRKKKRDGRSGSAPSRLTWRWDGPSTKRPGMRGKAKKQFYKAIARGSDLLNVGDSAVFLSTGRDHCPYIGRIESLWESWGGQMMVRVKWFYHPEETKGGKQLAQPKGALFESPHSDENDVQTISHKCQVLSFKDYNRRCAEAARKGHPLDTNTYYQAGYYDPTIGFMKLEPDVQ